jgi:predicted aspartyl protease
MNALRDNGASCEVDICANGIKVGTTGLVDTGAHTSAISLDAAKILQPKTLRDVVVAGMGTSCRTQMVAVDFIIEGHRFSLEVSVATQLKSHGAIIGRDVLQFCELRYNGPRGVVDLEIVAAAVMPPAAEVN